MNLKQISKMENKLESFLASYNHDIPLIFYGCGKAAYWAVIVFKACGIIPVAICDSDSAKHGTLFFDIPVMSIDDIMKKYKNFEVFISAPSAEKSIREYLSKYLKGEIIHCFSCELYLERNFNDYRKYIVENEIELNSLYKLLSDDQSREVMENVIKGWISYDLDFFNNVYSPSQYFPSDLITLSKEEVFVDVGGFIGDTFSDFYARVKGEFKKYYAFEPDNECFEKLTSACSIASDRTVLIKKGAYDKTTTLNFSIESNSFGGSRIGEIGNVQIEVVDIDSVIKEEVTFIKMDIEGSEIPALMGASELIKKYRPKLAICVYHKDDDFIKISSYILSVHSDYKLYLRHHNHEGCETVLYAI